MIMPFFQCSPLDDSSSQIRLLDLLPGSNISPIRCRLRAVELALARRTYEPLSYTWRSPTRHHNISMGIYIDGQRVTIGGTLWRALRALRHRCSSDGPRTLWVDAVCINQADTAEKNAQVQLMRHIYENGICTLIWLGASPQPYRSRAFSILKSLALFSEQHPGYSVSIDMVDALEEYATESQSERRLRRRLFIDEFRSGRALQAIVPLISEAYFNRVWIIQEVAVSQAATIFCGHHSLPWDTFERAITVIEEIAEFHPTRSLIKERRNFRSSAPESLLSKVWHARPFSATDARDKIYALLGLVNSDAPAIPIQVDYGTPPVDVFRTFTSNFLRATGDAGILAGSIGCRDPGSFTSLPSWAWLPVDSWTTSSPASLYAWDPESRNPQNFRASGTSTCSPVFDNEGKTLGLSGYEIDSVEAVASSMRLRGKFGLGGTELGAETVCAYLIWRRVAQVWPTRSYRGSNETTEDAFRKLVRPIYDREPGLSDEEHGALLSQFDTFIRNYFSFLERMPSSFVFVCCALRLLELSYRLFFLGLNHVAVLDRLSDILQMDERCLVRTRTGYLALAPTLTNPGDRVFVLEGSRAPLVLRRGSSARWKLVGDCQAQGLMNGEAWDEASCIRVWI
ncbi:heterokaryon incompatibility protein-domain-containing protein, partial [Lasiosphaeria ovina]